MPELNERVSDELVEKLAVSIFDMDGDNDTVPWERQPGRVRTRTRRTVRSVLSAISIHAPELQQRRASVVSPEMVEAAQFLIDRLDDFERDALQEDDGEYVLRQFGGHVSPAIELLTAALSVVSHETDGQYTAEHGLRRAREIALQSEAAPLSMGEIVKVADMALGENTPFPAWMTTPTDETQGVKPELPQDVIDLVIAARIVAFEDQSPEALRALDQASEAFASRVGWDDEPELPGESP